MYFLKTLIATWACLVQVSFAAVAFTKWPSTVYAGRPATVRWSGDANAPATITLRQGPADNLKTIKVLTTQAGGGSFTWVPEESLPDGSDYALQIEQNGSINYSGLLRLAHQPGKEPSATSRKAPVPADSTLPPLGGMRNGVQKGNNGYLPALNSSSPRPNMTSGKSRTQSKSSDAVSFRYVSPEMILAALAAIIYFAA
ncbi:GPI anchored serine-threonine rich family protein [Aspergillus lucknowensis]|uniref:Yeast cell wall synthesis Kre9/Knh1-like N-terminal domain-containing protein n=1 Tax=Aspergillus lucknowensis TaxID=176173 RepID=A0ABR4M039_9EURO